MLLRSYSENSGGGIRPPLNPSVGAKVLPPYLPLKKSWNMLKITCLLLLTNKNMWQQNVTFIYSDNQKTMKYEDNIISILKCIRMCYKANIFTRYLKNYFFVWNLSVFTAQLLCFMVIKLFKIKTWFWNFVLLFLSFLVITVCSLNLFLLVGGGGQFSPLVVFFCITQKVLVWGCWNFLTFLTYPKPSL